MPVAIVVVILIAGLGVYFSSNKSTDNKTLAGQEQRLQKEITKAKEKVTKEKDKLNGFERAFRTAFPFYGIADDGFRDVSEAVHKTDFLFENPDSATPKIKLQILAALEKSINDKRSQVSLALIAWKEKADIALAKNLDNKALQEIINEAQIVAAYVDELNLIVDNLTTSNSGLSQETINYYEDVLGGVTAVIDSTVIALENAQTVATAPANANTSANEVVVAVEQITTQQQVVANAEAQLQALEEALAVIVEQLAALEASSAEVIPDVVEQGYVDWDSLPDLIVQPGEPRLIQGSNHY